MIENFKQPINPHNNSVIPEKLNLEPKNKDDKRRHIKGEEYLDKETGDTFYKKKYWGGYPEKHLREHFVSLLIKGIFHSSEMVKMGEEEFFSRGIDLDHTEKAKPFEKEAETFILKKVLGDYDRNMDNHNIKQNDDGKFNQYDFESFDGYEFAEIHKSSRNARKIFHEFCEENKFSKDNIHDFSLQIFNKLDRLEQAVNDEKFISAILKKTEFEPPEEVVDIGKGKKIMRKIKKHFYKEDSNIQDVNVIRVRNLILQPIRAMKKAIKRNL